ncbi:hypothetical protein BFW01_g1355 [Lasiodiplodia theobromae]|uniref:Calcium-dependent cell adhesion molecule N-terminal domain-containing protein n=1 Tax=Lasiodiplodia theobromae TaxID=45133 RepID=A0A8H7ISC1_9PEZI|nr:hypothetical protein BFW01_g1355 [Lasiodiplodia theobromae]
MLFTNAFAVVPLMAALTIGAAIPEPEPSDASILALKTTVTVYTDRDWTGTSQQYTVDINTCQSLVGDDVNDHVNSVKVEDNFHCRFWQSSKCNKDFFGAVYAPGAKAVPSDLSNKISSFRCYAN